MELEKQRQKTASERVLSFWSVIKSWSGYLVMFLVIMTFAGPPLVINYVRTQIAEGEWTHLETAPADQFINQEE